VFLYIKVLCTLLSCFRFYRSIKGNQGRR